jgi:hypothetical protein
MSSVKPKRELGVAHMLTNDQYPLYELNKLIKNTMTLTFMLGAKSDSSPISELPFEEALFKKITELNFLYDKVRTRYHQQLPKMNVPRPMIKDKSMKRSSKKKTSKRRSK